MPRFLWLATVGKQAINDRLLVLRGRKVLAFPDTDGYDEWQKKLTEYTTGAVTLSGAKGLLDITISPLPQQNATAEEREAHIDIADWLMRSMGVGDYCHSEWQREKLLHLLRKRLRSLPRVLLTVPINLERPHLYKALALARCAKSDDEAIVGILYAAMSRGRLPLGKIWDLDMVRSVKDALRQLSNPGLDVTTDVFSYQVKQIQLNAGSPSEVNREGALLTKATLCHSVVVEERQLLADIRTLMGDTPYFGCREDTVAEMDSGSKFIVDHLTKKLAEVVWQKGSSGRSGLWRWRVIDIVDGREGYSRGTPFHYAPLRTLSPFPASPLRGNLSPVGSSLFPWPRGEHAPGNILPSTSDAIIQYFCFFNKTSSVFIWPVSKLIRKFAKPFKRGWLLYDINRVNRKA